MRSLLTRALAAYDARRPQRALMHFLLAAHAGVEAAQHNAGFLYAEEMPRLRPREAAYFAGRAVEYFKQASRQGSVEAQVQLGNLLAERSEYGLANAMFQQAAHAGSRDAIWHLGYHYWHGRGVEQSASTAWALFKSAGMHSRHARDCGAPRRSLSASLGLPSNSVVRCNIDAAAPHLPFQHPLLPPTHSFSVMPLPLNSRHFVRDVLRRHAQRLGPGPDRSAPGVRRRARRFGRLLTRSTFRLVGCKRY